MLHLQANEQTLLASVIRAVKNAGQSATFTAQALLVAGANTSVRLISSTALNIADTAGQRFGYALGGAHHLTHKSVRRRNVPPAAR